MSAPTLDLSVRTVTLPPTTTGSVRFDWLQAVVQIAGRSKALHVAVLLLWLAAHRGRPDITVTRRHMALWSLSRDACGDALRLLRAHGLVLVWSAAGRARIVVLTEPGSNQPQILGESNYRRLQAQR